MNLKGRRIHLAGSAAPDADELKLQYAHRLVTELVAQLARQGANFIVPFGKEPFLQDRDTGPSITFDWTAAEAVFETLKAGATVASSPSGRLVYTLATSKTDGQIPSARRAIYDGLRAADAVSLEFMDPGWSAGAHRRQRLAETGDIFIGLSGGEGVEHLAVEYSSRGKPVIPLDLQLGASQKDGSGGAARLFDRALARPDDFFRVVDGASAADLLDRTRTRDGSSEVATVVEAVMKLLHSLAAPRVFYVRLLNHGLPEFDSVERFFRKVADPLVVELGYDPIEMGLGKNEFAWMNQAIFDSLHFSSVALVDLSALRPNCFMELGYALGKGQRVIITARDDTKFPFDATALGAFFWGEKEDVKKMLGRFRDHWERNIDMPKLVAVRKGR